MAAPQRRYRASAAKRSGARTVVARRPPEAAARKKAAGRRRRFAVSVLVPVLLMLGSVYVHAVAANVDADAAHLNEEKARAEAEAERLEVKVTELSGPGRIRSLAGEDLGMRDPASEDLRTYGGDGEDVTEDGTGEQKANGG